MTTSKGVFVFFVSTLRAFATLREAPADGRSNVLLFMGDDLNDDVEMLRGNARVPTGGASAIHLP